MAIAPGVHLLPVTSTPLEQALAATTGRFNQIPVPLDTLWDPARCPEHLLPWLAWALSVDIWHDEWPVERKRYVCAESFTLHRLKGTLEGIRRHVHLEGVRVVGAIVPPSNLFMDRQQTIDERRAFLARYPQLRVHRFRSQGDGGPSSFCGSFPDDNEFLVAEDAAARFGRRAFLFEPRDGTERPLTIAERTLRLATGVATTYEEIRIPGMAGVGVFADDTPQPDTYFDGDEPGRIVNVQIDKSMAVPFEEMRLKTVAPGLDPIQINPEHVAVQGTSGAGCFLGDSFGEFLEKETAGERLFDRLYLFDPERDVSGTDGSEFIAGRFGMPAYHAELTLEVRNELAPDDYFEFEDGFWPIQDNSRLNDALSAVRVSKSHRDKVLVTTRTHRPLTFGDWMRFGGGHKFGTLIRSIN